MSEINSKTNELSSQARAAFAATTNGGGMLTTVVLLSGLLSAIFFWQNSTRIFANVWPPAALVLGLLVGLVPAEGAFFGWKRIRASKPDMTAAQLKATTVGILVAVGSSIFSTFALFVMSFDSVPAEIQRYSDWFVFLALSVPVVAQVAIYAWFATNERTVVENHERAKLGAMGFDAHIQMEQARLMSIIRGMQAAMDAQLEEYGINTGANEAGKLLRDGTQQLLSMGKDGDVAKTAVSPKAEKVAQPAAPITYAVVHVDPSGKRMVIKDGFADVNLAQQLARINLSNYALGHMVLVVSSDGKDVYECSYEEEQARNFR